MAAMVRAGGVRGYEALVRSLGGDPDVLLARQGLTSARLSDEDALLPLDSVIDLFEHSATATHCPDFTLRLSQVQDIHILGPIAVAIQNCPTLDRALDCIHQYLFIQSPGLSFQVRDAGEAGADSVRLVYAVKSGRANVARQALAHGLALAHRIVSALAGPAYRVQGVSLDHEPAAGAAVLADFFGAPVQVSADACALHLPRRLLTIALPSANPLLLRMAEDFLDANFANPARSLTARLHQLLARRLGSLSLDKQDAARTLAMHPRTLQRRLAAEATTYNAVRDAVRREAALRYLTGTRLPLVQVASLVGFSEQSALARFCRQQFGRAPGELRANG